MSMVEQFFSLNYAGRSDLFEKMNIRKEEKYHSLSLMDVINGKLWDHMWYIYSIIGIYLVLPIIKPYIMQKENNVYYLVGILFLFTIFVPEMNNRLGLSFDVAFPMTGYLFYICAGAAIARCRVIERKYRNLVWGAVCVMILIYFISGRDKIYTYTSIPVCIMALSVFILVTKGNISVGETVRKL